MKIVSITGPDGAGKSTLIKHLLLRLPGARPVTVWDLLINPNTKGYLPFSSAKEVDTYLSILEPVSRAYFLLHCMRTALDLAKKENPPFVLVDGYWYKYMATEMAHGADKEELMALVEGFPGPDLNIYLEVAPDQSTARKEVYSGYECGFAEERNAESFHEFQVKVREAMEELMEREVPYRLDTSEGAEEVAKKALWFIKRRLVLPKVIAVLGIDGSGKSGLAQRLSDRDEENETLVMPCPQFHRNPEIPQKELSEALENLNQVADELGNFVLKGTALYLQMTLFGAVQKFYTEQRPTTLITERHALLDTLVYSGFYKQMVHEALDADWLSGEVVPLLEKRQPGATKLVTSWSREQNSRMGRSVPLAELGLYVKGICELEPAEMLKQFWQEFQTGLPDKIILVDVDPAVAMDRLAGREGQVELHEQKEVLTQLRGGYLQLIEMIKQLAPDIETLIVNSDAAFTEEDLEKQVLEMIED